MSAEPTVLNNAAALGVMDAASTYQDNPIAQDRLDWISRWGGATEDEARIMAADLWQRRAADEFAKNWDEVKAEFGIA